MKTFLKVTLLIVLALIAIKLLPLTVGLGILLGLSLLGLLAVGVSALALVVGLVVVLAAALAPIWIPVLALIGIISLCRRGNSRPVAS